MRRFLLIILEAAMIIMTACSNSEGSNGDDLTTNKTQAISTSVSGTYTEMPEASSAAASDNREPQQSTDKEENDLNIEITVGGSRFSAALYDNETAREFKERLPLTLDMSELNGNEKYYYFPDSLPKNSSIPSGINAGDIMLYGSDCLVIFYESFSTSYSYTPIGKIDNPEGLAEALGSGGVQVTFMKSN